MSKAGSPRWRYIAIHMDSPIDRIGLTSALGHGGGAAGVPMRLTRFQHPHAIVRVAHTDLSRARQLLPLLSSRQGPIRIRTLLTSGTIRSLTDRLGILHDRGKPQTRPE